MNLVLAIIPVLLLIILMAFFKMSGDKSSVISLVVTMLIAFFGFHFPVNDLLSSFLKSRLFERHPIDHVAAGEKRGHPVKPGNDRKERGASSRMAEKSGVYERMTEECRRGCFL